MDEEQSRTEVALCTRLLVHAGILGYSGHVSARLGDGERIVIQTVDDVRADVLPERLLVVDLDGSVVAGEGSAPSEVFIHTELYRARPDVGAVAHVHHDPTTVFSMVKGAELVPMKNHASRWASGVPVHRDASHIDDRAKAAALAATVGDANAALLRAHGQVLLAENVRALFVDAVHFVENADFLAKALLLGPVEPLAPDEIAAFLSTFRRDRHVAKVWSYYAAAAERAGAIPGGWR